MSELNKFRVIGQLHFQKRISPSHVSEFPFQKLQYVQKHRVFFIKPQYSFILKQDRLIKALYDFMVWSPSR